MKKIVKIICLVLALTLFAAMAIASGSDSNTSDEVKAPSSVTTNDSATQNNNNSTAETDDNKTPTAQPSTTNSTKETIEEAVILEQDGIKITVKSLDLNAFMGPEIKLLIENNTDKSVTVQTRDASVNGYMVSTMMSADVAAGKKANDKITIMNSNLKDAGITTIADVELSFHVFDSDTWSTIFDSEMIRIETSAADGYNYTYDNSGTPIYNENDIEIVVKGLSNDSILGPSLVVYISNNGSQDVTVQTRDVSINGFMVTAMLSCDVKPGKHAIDTVSFLNSEIKENDIKTVDNVELSFHIFDSNSWKTIVDTSPVRIDF